MQIMKAALVAAIGIVACLACLRSGSAEDHRRLALTVTIDGAIGPASASYVKEALVKASERRAEIVPLDRLHGKEAPYGRVIHAIHPAQSPQAIRAPMFRCVL